MVDYVGGEEGHTGSTKYIHLMSIGSLMSYDDSLWGRHIGECFVSLGKGWLTSLSESKPTYQNCTSLPSPPLAVGLKLGLASQLATWEQRLYQSYRWNVHDNEHTSTGPVFCLVRWAICCCCIEGESVEFVKISGRYWCRCSWSTLKGKWYR